MSQGKLYAGVYCDYIRKLDYYDSTHTQKHTPLIYGMINLRIEKD